MNKCPWKVGEIYLLRGGLSARIYRTDAPGRCPIHGAISCLDGSESVEMWDLSGTILGNGVDSRLDLIPPEPRRFKTTRWINIYPDTHLGGWHASKADADLFSHSDRLACVAVEFDIPEGYGLDKAMPPIIVRGE